MQQQEMQQHLYKNNRVNKKEIKARFLKRHVQVREVLHRDIPKIIKLACRIILQLIKEVLIIKARVIKLKKYKTWLKAHRIW
jgi:hypothetical protein